MTETKFTRRKSYISRDERRFTVLVAKDKNIELAKYKTIEDASGEHLNINLFSLLAPPPKMSNNDWIIVNLVDFLERIELLYSSCSLFCNSDTCPLFNAGPKYCYLWIDDDSSKSTQISAPEYFLALKRYIKRNLKNKHLFPKKLNEEFSEKALKVLKTSFRRLFRILAHLYVCHFEDISNLPDINLFEIMNTILAHYTNFSILYHLCQPEDFAIFEPIFKNINEHSTPTFHCPKFSTI